MNFFGAHNHCCTVAKQMSQRVDSERQSSGRWCSQLHQRVNRASFPDTPVKPFPPSAMVPLGKPRRNKAIISASITNCCVMRRFMDLNSSVDPRRFCLLIQHFVSNHFTTLQLGVRFFVGRSVSLCSLRFLQRESVGIDALTLPNLGEFDEFKTAHVFHWRSTRVQLGMSRSV